MLKEIPDFEGYYISDNGMVYSTLGRGRRDKAKHTAPYPLKTRMTKGGYLRVYMRQTSTNKRVDRYVHILVAQAFLGCPNFGNPTVNHKDFNKTNNNVTNLEWVTQADNLQRSKDAGRIRRDKITGRFLKLK